MNNKQIRKYFAAANSYDGFVSYFDKVFPSKDFSRIYVLKGGPGTGKSSLMKRISKELSTTECEIDEIYCSSDPQSLDGVIINHQNKRIAIIDGTAPHERDAIVPGAIDEIINLGENWDSRWLVANREKILSKGSQKSESYKMAYAYLKNAGVSHDHLMSLYRRNFNKFNAKTKAESIIPNSRGNKRSILKYRLLSSFGKLGNYNLPLTTENDYALIFISGDAYSSSLFLEECRLLCETHNLNQILYPSALAPGLLDAIELPDDKVIIAKNENGTVNPGDYCALSKIDKEYYKIAEQIKKDALDEAQRWFLVASNIHFEMEEIYNKAMDFSENERVFRDKLTEIKNILEI